MPANFDDTTELQPRHIQIARDNQKKPKKVTKLNTHAEYKAKSSDQT